MTNQKTVSIKEVSAFKIFTRDNEGLLQSAFLPAFKYGLKYPSNECISADTEDANFFAFANFKDALLIAHQGHKEWRMVKGKLIVLPVTMYDVVKKGKYKVQSHDAQTLDSFFPAFESKKITVHDTPQSRNDFYTSVLEQWLKNAKGGMEDIEKEALAVYAPHLAQFV